MCEHIWKCILHLGSDMNLEPDIHLNGSMKNLLSLSRYITSPPPKNKNRITEGSVGLNSPTSVYIDP